MACKDGVAYPVLTWNTPISCRSASAHTYHTLLKSTSRPPTPVLVKRLILTSIPTMDSPLNQITFSVARYPSPDGCGKDRSKTGVVPEPDNNWLDVQTHHANMPGLYNGTLATSRAWTQKHALTTMPQFAPQSRASGQFRAWTRSLLRQHRIGNTNQRPSILSSSLGALREVEEDSLPGHTIGPKLQACSEVSVGLQQLTWTIV